MDGTDLATDGSASINRAFWARQNLVRAYQGDALKPAEAVILARHREALSGRVLDAGCGAGRILAYLVLLGADAHGFDISAAMVDHCHARFPSVDVHIGDIGAPAATETPGFDAIFASDNVIDVLDDRARRTSLGQMRELLAPGGLLIFSSHNLDAWDHRDGPQTPAGRRSLTTLALRLLDRPMAGLPADALRAGRSVRNRRRLAPLQHRADDHAVLNDSAHEFGLLHYYVGREAQERQLTAAGLTPVETLEIDGTTVPAGQAGRSDSLYYVARCT